MTIHNPEDIRSAHAKQFNARMGQGGIVFTEAEKAVLDQGVWLEVAAEIEAKAAKGQS